MIELFKTLAHNPKAATKFLIALLGAVGVAVSVGLLPASAAPWVAVVSAFASSLGVYAVPNTSAGTEKD